MLQLIQPDISHKEQWEEMTKEWKDLDSRRNPSSLFEWSNYSEFLAVMARNKTSPEPRKVPSTIFFLIQDGHKILWVLEIRHHIDHPNVSEVGGHIAYGIRPSARRQWYAKKMLALWLQEAQKLWLQKVLITCSDDNIWSYKVIEANGGVFERFSEKDGIKKRRYWIDLYQEEKSLLQKFEWELLEYNTRHNPKRIDELLADDFFECGKTGSMFGKKECLESLQKEPKEKIFEASDMEVHMLSEAFAQTRFLCKIQNPWENPTTSFRTSLWRKTEKWWQMFFHQGTIIANNNTYE